MKKRLWMLLLAVAALLALCLGAAACDGGNEKSSISVIFHGTSDVTVTADAGDTIDPPANPQKTGYTFAGWFIDAALTDPFDAEKTYSENFEVWAKFTANTDTPYTVKHLQQDVAGDGYTEVTADRENKTGTTDTQTTAAAKAYEGFTAQTVTQGNIAGDGSTVVEIRYDRNTFDVTLVNGTESKTIEGVRYGASAAVLYADENVPAKQGYAFAGWYTSENAKVEETAVLTAAATYTAQFTANTDTPYTVKHLQQDVAGDGYTEVTADRENKTGTTDTQTTAAAKAYEGFTAQTVTQGNIAGDGSTVVEIRYDRNTFDVTLVNGTESKTIEGVRYGASAAVLYADENVPAKQGYAFAGWYTSENAKVEETAVLTAAATYTAQFTANTDTPYKVEYYLEALNGSYAIAAEETQTLTGTTDATVQAQPKSIEHYTFDENKAGNVTSGTVAADGSLILKLYYTRNLYTITFKNGEAVLGEPQSVKYGALPVYMGETPEKAATSEFVYLFKDFGSVVPAAADAEYSAQYYEVKNYSGYVFTEVFTLPDVSAAFAGAELKQYIDDTEIAAGEQNAAAGSHVWKIAVMNGADEVSSAQMNIEVCTEAEYWANYGSGDTDQFADRFFVEADSQVTFGFEYLDEDVYGVGGAYRYTASGTFAAWNQRLELLRTTTIFDTSAYDTLEFDLWINSGNATFPYAIFSGARVEYQLFSVYDPQTGTPADESALETGKWYHFSANVPMDKPEYSTVYIILAADNETTDCYIRNISFCNREFVAVNGSKAAIAETEETVSGRSGVLKYTTAAGAWDSRIQFSQSLYEQWNALTDGKPHVLAFDICFTAEGSSLYIRPIGLDWMDTTYTHLEQDWVTIFDSEGNAVRSPEANVWYTLEFRIDLIGKLNYGSASDDIGIQMAISSDTGGTFYLGSGEFREVEVSAQDVLDYFKPKRNDSAASITEVASGGGRENVYKYESTQSAWDSRVQLTTYAYAYYMRLFEAGGGKLVFDVCSETPISSLGFLQFWFTPVGGSMADFTSEGEQVTIKDADGETVTGVSAGVWYTLEIDIAARGALNTSQGLVDDSLCFAFNNDGGGVFYIDNVHFEAAA